MWSTAGLQRQVHYLVLVSRWASLSGVSKRDDLLTSSTLLLTPELFCLISGKQTRPFLPLNTRLPGEIALLYLDLHLEVWTERTGVWLTLAGESFQSLLCTRGPSVLGRQSSVLRGWSSSVQQARNLGGAWLDTHVEERVAVPFTGADIVKEKDGSVVVYMSNALGDLFAKQLVRRDDEEDEEDSSILEEVVIKREDTWMERIPPSWKRW